MDNKTYSRAMTDHSKAAGWIRLAGGATLAGLALITAIISYSHALYVVRATGTTGWVAYLVPLVADLLIVAASLAVLDSALRGERWPWFAMCAVLVGVGSTLAMNVAAGLHRGWQSGLVNALAPVALVFAYELVMWIIRREMSGDEVELAEPCPHTIEPDPEAAAVQWFLHGRDCLGLPTKTHSQRTISDRWPITRATLGQAVKDYDNPPTTTPELITPAGAELNGSTPATGEQVTA